MQPSVWDDSGYKSEWVDIRTRYIDGEDKRPTKVGVMLRLSEFRMILPLLKKHKEWIYEQSTRYQTDPMGKYVDREIKESSN